MERDATSRQRCSYVYVYVYVDDHMKAAVQDVSVQLAELVGMVINTRQVCD